MARHDPPHGGDADRKTGGPRYSLSWYQYPITFPLSVVPVGGNWLDAGQLVGAVQLPE